MRRTYKLAPGLLVNVKTTMEGNCTYHKRDLSTERDGASERAEWQAERLIADKAEHERAKQVRSAATYLVRRVCTPVPFGYHCESDKADALELAITAATKMVDEFNASARVTYVGFYVAVSDCDSTNVAASAAKVETGEAPAVAAEAPESPAEAPAVAPTGETPASVNERALAALKRRREEARAEATS